ncbi:MAG: sensor histidine kinase [Flavobacteriaceae bacterium]
MKAIKLLLIFIVFFSLHKTFSQQQQIDKIKAQLTNTNPNDSLKIKMYGDLGWYYSNISIDSAFKYSKIALRLSQKINHQKGIAQSYNDIGIIHYRISAFDSSIVYYKKSLELRIQQKDSIGIASIYNKIGIAQNQLFKLDSAIYYTLESLKIYEGLKLTKYVAVNLNNIANLYRDTKQYNKALEKHREALSLRNTLNDNAGKVQSYVGIGNINLFLKNIDSAKIYYKKGIDLGEQLNLRRELSTCYNNLGNIYKNENDFKTAIKYYDKAFIIRKQLNDNYGLASVALNLGDIYLRERKFKQADVKLYEALGVATKINAKELIQNTYRTFEQVKAYLNQPDSVVYYQEQYIILQDSLLNEKITSQVSQFETKYETEKKEKEILLQREQILANELVIKNRNMYAVLLSSALILVALFSFGVYRKNQFKRKQLQKELDLKDALTTIKTQNRLQEQRLRISRDLHDNIGSQLTFIISSIDNLKFATKDASLTLKEKLNSISTFTSDTIFQLRDTIWAMNKNTITLEDLHTRILSFIEKAKNATENIEFSFNQKIKEPLDFSSLKGINLFRVIQEGINNAIKYAEATNINIIISKENNQVVISIIDNGVGFNMEKITLGNGLTNMEKRMSEIGGTLKINSEPKQGTTIQIICKL